MAASRKAPVILGSDAQAWENWIFLLAEKHHLQVCSRWTHLLRLSIYLVALLGSDTGHTSGQSAAESSCIRGCAISSAQD